MIVERSVTIARDIEEVFAFVADPRNDPIWCPKVESVEPVGDPAEGPGARFAVVHRPIPFRPSRRMDYTLLDWEPPNKIEWREDDGHDLLAVTYRLEAVGEGTRFVQHDDATLAAPAFLHPLMKLGIGADVAKQLKRLRTHLTQEVASRPGCPELDSNQRPIP
jgi:uncharacterized protein YndB with AHSA1/START domain